MCQAEHFGIFTFNVPPGFTKSEQGSKCSFVSINEQKNTYCIMILGPAEKSMGSLDKDFDHQWNTTVKEVLKPDANPQKIDGGSSGNWKLMTGASSFKKDGSVGAVVLCTYSNSINSASIIYLFNDTGFQHTIDQFASGVDIKELDQASAPAANHVEQTNSLVGEWFSNSDVLGNYVTASGQYAGDASVAANEKYLFTPGGRYEYFYASTRTSQTNTYLYKGRYVINGNTVTFTPDFYEHKLNNRPQPNTNPNNLKVTVQHFKFIKDDSKNVWALRFTSDDNLESDLLYKKP